ncbi:MAG: hypothetical protein ACKO85_17590, partial [Isosphaeraceae bacterium]
MSRPAPSRIGSATATEMEIRLVPNLAVIWDEVLLPSASSENLASKKLLKFIPVKKSHGLLCQGTEVKYRFILEHKAFWPIEIQCRVLEVSRSGYYKWLDREPSLNAVKQAELVQEIRRISELPRHDD